MIGQTAESALQERNASLRILVAEGNAPLAQLFRRILQMEGYRVDTAFETEAAWRLLLTYKYHLLLLDLGLPKMDEAALLQQIRAQKSELGILVVTEHSSVDDRVLMLDNGADDCVVKPFAVAELKARVRALLRRSGNVTSRVMRVSDLEVFRDEFRAERGGQRLELTAKEFAVLEYLVRNARRTVTRAMIMENVWKMPYDPTSNLVDVYMKYVRDKVDVGFPAQLIRTVRGIGYVLSEPGIAIAVSRDKVAPPAQQVDRPESFQN